MMVRGVAGLGFLFGLGFSSWKSSSSTSALSPKDFQRGSELICTKEYRDFPRAKEGNTPVYLPPGLPIVLKKSYDNCEKRLSKMAEARKVCKSIGAKRLVIPEARKHGDFLIEDRIPFSSIDSLEQIGLYINNREKFTQAIRELTAFFCRASVDDLKTLRFLYGTLSSPIPRFDNMPLYIENGEGKIALIDLEKFSPTPNEPDSCWSDLIYFFPYHAEDILDVAKSMQLSDPFCKSQKCLTQYEFERLRAIALATYERAYLGHQNFLVQHGIYRETASQFPIIDTKRLTAIKNSLKKYLETRHCCTITLKEVSLINQPPLKFRGVLSEEEKEKIRAFVDRVIPKAIALLQEELEILLSICKESKQDIVQCRSVMMDFNRLAKVNTYLKSQSDQLFPEKEESGRTISLNHTWVLSALLRTMVEEGAFYDYMYYNGETRIFRL